MIITRHHCCASGERREPHAIIAHNFDTAWKSTGGLHKLAASRSFTSVGTTGKERRAHRVFEQHLQESPSMPSRLKGQQT